MHHMTDDGRIYSERAGKARADQLSWARDAKRYGNLVFQAGAQHHQEMADFWGRAAAEANKPAPRPSLLRRVGEFLGVV